jgi:molecular chaperone HscB
MTVTQNFFELFGLAQNYDIDEPLLLSRYRDMQRAAHPDRHANASPRQKRLAVQRSGLINEAYHTLSAPLLRACHILECTGISVDMESTGGSPEFLELQIRENERLQALQANNDLDGLKEMASALDEQWSAMQKDFSEYMGSNDTEAALGKFRDMQFLDRMRSRVTTAIGGAVSH